MAEAFEDRDHAGIKGLPEVTPAHAAALRKALLNRRFVPSTHRLPDEVLPDPALIRVIDQGKESLSVGVGLAATLNYLRARDGDTRLVSARMLYEFARRYDEWTDQPHSGSSLTGALAALGERGVCLDSEWPLSQKDQAASPEALRAARGNRPAAMRQVEREVEAIRQRRREAAVADQDQTLQTLVAREEAARHSLLDAEKRMQDLQHEVNELQPGRMIMRFIEERSRSSDYRSRLGIVSLVRRDFERLSELADSESKEHNAELMPVERIILYVDDLDRCKPDRVIEVLEAVHLFLAFRLLMVVVAVAPRWLRHCLERPLSRPALGQWRAACAGRACAPIAARNRAGLPGEDLPDPVPAPAAQGRRLPPPGPRPHGRWRGGRDHCRYRDRHRHRT